MNVNGGACAFNCGYLAVTQQGRTFSWKRLEGGQLFTEHDLIFHNKYSQIEQHSHYNYLLNISLSSEYLI